ncbi:PKD/REJ-like domain, partial [Gonioctena quinquepunctata]
AVFTKEYALDESICNMKLSAVTGESNRQSTNQTIRVKRKFDFASTFGENSKPDIDVTKKTILFIRCVGDCESVDFRKGTWTINITNFDYDKYTDYGQHSDILSIKPNVLVFGKYYDVSFSHPGIDQGYGFLLHTHADIKSFTCKLQPEVGYAAKTIFHLNCDAKVTNRKYEVFSSNKNDVLLTSGTKLADLAFVLSVNDKVKVKLIDPYRSESVSTLVDVTLKSIFENVTNEEELKIIARKEFFDENSNESLIGLMNSKKHDKLMQTIMALANEFALLQKNDTYADTIKDFDNEMLEMIEKVITYI